MGTLVSYKILKEKGFADLIKYVESYENTYRPDRDIIRSRFNRNRMHWGKKVLKEYPQFTTKIVNEIGEVRYSFARFIDVISKFA